LEDEPGRRTAAGDFAPQLHSAWWCKGDNVETSTFDIKLSRAGEQMTAVTIAVALAFAVRLAIDPFIGDKHQFVPAYAAIAAITWMVGWRAGAVTALICLLSGELFNSVSPLDSTTTHVAIAFMGYVGVSTSIISLAEWLRREKQEAAVETRELREADERMADFMALLAHELRSPLATIAMASSLPRAGALDPLAAGRALAIIERQAEHMTKLVCDLLDVSRVRTGKLSIHREMFDLFAVVQEAVGDVHRAMEAKQQKVRLLQPDPIGFIYADPQRIRQIVVNLVQNACKFSPEGGEIEISLLSYNFSICIAVKDSGIGIQPSDLQRIFEPFVQVGTSDATVRGLGLGLPLTRELAQMHGGDVRAFSAGPGRGSEFIVTLPRQSPPKRVMRSSRRSVEERSRAYPGV
jgi:signal transduction histidine kinase